MNPGGIASDARCTVTSAKPCGKPKTFDWETPDTNVEIDEA